MITDTQLSELANALTYLDLERMDMGDSHEEIVEFLCDKANIDFDSGYAYVDEFYFYNKSLEAYKSMLTDGSINELIESIVDENYDNLDYLMRAMVYSKEKPINIVEHPTVNAICLLDAYIQKLNDISVCSLDHKLKMSEMKEKLLSVDIELCYIGNILGQSFFRYLNPEYYFHSNDSFTVGHILSDDELERKFGEYSIHAEIRSSVRNNMNDHGYTVAFKRIEDDIIAHLYSFTKTYNPLTMNYTDTGCILSVDAKDLEKSAKELANKINELTEQSFSNGMSTPEQQENFTIRRKRGR